MAGLYRTTVTRFYDAAGRQCSSFTPGAKRVKEKSKTWHGKYRGPDGKPARVSLKTTDREEAQDKLSKLVKKARRESADDYCPSEVHRDRPLSVHLDDYKNSLSSKGDCPKHINTTVKQIQSVIDGCALRLIRDISASAVMKFLADKRKPYTIKVGKKEKQRRGIGPSTFNSYLIAVKGFTAWLVKERRAKQDSLSHLSRINAKVDVRHERRPLTADEFQRVITAAEKSERVYRGISGADRARLYLTAAFTGLRAAELASLTPASFGLGAAVPTVTVEAGYSKRGERDTLPLHADVVTRLRGWFKERIRPQDGKSTVLSLPNASERHCERLWPGTWFERGAEMFRIDLKAANVPYLTAEGFADLHSLRHTYCTNLANSGAHPKVMQELARHSTITLTLDRYSHAGLLDMNKALQGLPSVNVSKTATATGTDG